VQDSSESAGWNFSNGLYGKRSRALVDWTEAVADHEQMQKV